MFYISVCVKTLSDSTLPPRPLFLSLLSQNPQKSSMTGVPFLSLEGALEFNPEADPLQNEALVHMWMEVKIKPLLKSVTKHFLSCLSTKNFSCSSYQMMYVWVSEHLTVSRTFVTPASQHPPSSYRVRELSKHFSEMNPVRQKWIYTFFMYPFLSGPHVAGKDMMCSIYSCNLDTTDLTLCLSHYQNTF